jgi:hypothetical protein
MYTPTCAHWNIQLHFKNKHGKIYMSYIDRPKWCDNRSEAMYQNFIWNVVLLPMKNFLTQLILQTYLTGYTKGKVGTKFSSDHFLCGFTQGTC